MWEAVAYSIRVKLAWLVLEKLVKIGLDSIRKGINRWESTQLQLKLHIIDEKRITLDGLTEKTPHMLIGLHLDSKIPTKLCPEKVFGKLEVKGNEYDFFWDIREKEISRHIIEDIDVYGNEWWGFHIPLPYALLKTNVQSTWRLHFVVIFQHQLSKTFKDIEFKVRNSDIKDIQALAE